MYIIIYIYFVQRPLSLHLTLLHDDFIVQGHVTNTTVSVPLMQDHFIEQGRVSVPLMWDHFIDQGHVIVPLMWDHFIGN